MGNGSGRVMQWVKGNKGSECEVGGPLPPAIGVMPTLVIARSSGVCHDGDAEHPHKGIVFYDAEPVAWCCLADGDIGELKTWAVGAFPSLQIVTVADPSIIINCPPPHPSARGPAVRDLMRNELRALAPLWFVPAKPTDATTLVV